MPVVQVPGQGDIEFPDTMSDDDIAAAIQKNLSPQPRQNTMLEDLQDPRAWKRALGLMARTGIEAVAGIPNMAASAGVQIGNLANRAMGREPIPVPAEKFEQALNSLGLPQYQGIGENVVGLLGQAVMGGKLPAPTGVAQAPKNFTPNTLLARAQEKGLVVPPSAAKPSVLNSMLEGIAGRPALAEAAAIKNQPIFNRLAAAEAGLAPKEAMTIDSLRAARNAMGKDYEVLANAGEIKPDSKYFDDIQEAAGKFIKAKGGSLGGVIDENISKAAEALQQNSWQADEAILAVRSLRDKASAAFRAGESQSGRALKGLANAVESATERFLQNKGGDSAKLVSAYRTARQSIAKNKSVEDALNTATGNVVAKSLASEDAATGNLKLIGDFYNAFKPAAREIVGAPKAFSQADAFIPGAAAAATGQNWWLAYPLLRQGLRAGLLSPTGQRALTGLGLELPPEAILGGAVPASSLLGR